MPDPACKPALIVVDLQEDFCPPNGSLAVEEGRDVASVVNDLLSVPSFVIRVATKDWHPADHISFASNHAGKQPFVDTVTVVNPHNANETYETRLWPVHCVQGSPGAALIPELHVDKVDRIIEKGQRKEVEMYSAFYDPLTQPRVSDSGLSGVLKEHGVTDVYVVGLAADYCVQSTALDAVKEGFKTYIVEEGTRPVDGKAWADGKQDLQNMGVRLVSLSGPEVERLR